MNKSELVAKVAESAGLTKAAAAKSVDTVLAAIAEQLSEGGEVQLIGFGSFKTSTRAAKTGRNPMTGAAMEIPAKVVPKFIPGAALKKAVNT